MRTAVLDCFQCYRTNFYWIFYSCFPNFNVLELLLCFLFFVAFGSYLICALCFLISLKILIVESLQFPFAPYTVFFSGSLLFPLGCSPASCVGGSLHCLLILGSYVRPGTHMRLEVLWAWVGLID